MVSAGSLDRETSLGDFRVSLLLGLVLGLVGLAGCACWSVDQASQFDHRIVRGGHSRGTAFVELSANGGILQFGGRNQFHRAIAGRFSGQNFLDKWIAETKTRSQVGQRIGKRQLFDIFVNRFSGEEIQFQRFAIAVAELGKSLSVRLGTLVTSAQKPTGILEERAIETTRERDNWRWPGRAAFRSNCKLEESSPFPPVLS